MTRARNRTQGLGDPPLIQLWLEAVLCAFVSLVQGVRTTLGMIFKRSHRDWHTTSAQEDLPQATSGTSSQETKTTHGVILGLVPRISVGSSRGLTVIPLETHNRDSRHKAENDPVVVPRQEADKVRVPGEGRGPVLRAARTPATPITRAFSYAATGEMRQTVLFAA